MATGNTRTFYEDSAKTIGLFPRTKITAVSDSTGNTLDQILNGKQAALVSGTSIKTINGASILASGNLSLVQAVTAGLKNCTLSESEYNALQTKDANTLYFVYADPE